MIVWPAAADERAAADVEDVEEADQVEEERVVTPPCEGDDPMAAVDDDRLVEAGRPALHLDLVVRAASEELDLHVLRSVTRRLAEPHLDGRVRHGVAVRVDAEVVRHLRVASDLRDLRRERTVGTRTVADVSRRRQTVDVHDQNRSPCVGGRLERVDVREIRADAVTTGRWCGHRRVQMVRRTGSTRPRLLDEKCCEDKRPDPGDERGEHERPLVYQPSCGHPLLPSSFPTPVAALFVRDTERFGS